MFSIFNRNQGTKKKSERKHEIISKNNPKSAMAEAYRTLRTNLGFTDVDNPCRSILVSSSNPQDGKSTTTSNLAVVMAQNGNKVLLVDGDLRKPVMHKIFEVPNHKGITNHLMGQMTLEEALHYNVADHLDLLTSGPIPPNPAEILNSAKTRAFWPMLLERYDYVLIDAPPVLAVTDATILSSQVDGVLLVIRSGVTRNEVARTAYQQFVNADARLLGVVLNQVKMNRNGYQYYNYYYYYVSEEDQSVSI